MKLRKNQNPETSLEDKIREYFEPFLQSIITAMSAPNRIKKTDIDPSFLAEILNTNDPGSTGGSKGVIPITGNYTVTIADNGSKIDYYGTADAVITLDNNLPAKNTFLAFENFSETGKLSYTLGANFTAIKDDGSAFSGNINLLPGKQAFIINTSTDYQLRFRGDWSDVTPPPAAAKRILIDFGRTDLITPVSGGRTWNNITSGATGAGVPNLKDINGLDTGISIALVEGGSVQAATSANRGYNAAVGDYPFEATNDYIQYYRAEADGVWRTWRISGLGTTARTLKIFSSVNSSGSRTTLFRVNGDNNTIIERNSLNNSVVDQFATVAPVGGNIDLGFNGKVSGTDTAYINVLEITWT